MTVGDTLTVVDAPPPLPPAARPQDGNGTLFGTLYDEPPLMPPSPPPCHVPAGR